MEEKFAAIWQKNREKAQELGVRIRPLTPQEVLPWAKRVLSGSRLSDGFGELQKLGHLELTVEALAVDKSFTGLFTDDEANEALSRLLEAGYRFR